MDLCGRCFIRLKYFNRRRILSSVMRPKLFRITTTSLFLFCFLFLLLYHENGKNSYDEDLSAIYGPGKYLTINMETASEDLCGGLGNMMWRTASLLAISRVLNRTVFFERRPFKCYQEYEKEFKGIFKNNHQIFKFMDVEREHIKMIDYAGECCKYDPPNRLLNERAQFVKMWGNYLQSFKYFQHLKPGEIREFFEFQEGIKRRAANYGHNLFRNKSTKYNFCVHTRRSDFIKLRQSSDKYFTERAIAFMLRHLKKNINEEDISVMVFGDDKEFISELRIDEKHALHMPNIANRAVNLCFASTHCNSLLITAPTSTFAWWMAYLMPEASPILYFSCRRECSHIAKRDFFPPHWLPLVVNGRTGRVEIDDDPY